MRVAIVDEGIDRQALLYPERIRKTLILHEGTTLHDIPEGEHGTTCARLLEQCTDNYELFDVRITESCTCERFKKGFGMLYQRENKYHLFKSGNYLPF